jgi:putative glutamine amidotransferase
MDKILVVNDIRDCGFSYFRPFESLGRQIHDCSAIGKVGIAMVVFTGGSDVSPSMYGEEEIPAAGVYTMPKRDRQERQVFKAAKEAGIPMFGICRGAQFLCAMAGGKLVQHVDGHQGWHEIITDDGRRMRVNSLHHQMQIPPVGAVPLAWADPRPGKNFLASTIPDRDHECVYYPSIKAIGVQYHPEAMSEDSDGFRYTVELAKKLISGEAPVAQLDRAQDSGS